MDAVEEQVPDVVETVLSFFCPGEGDGLTVFAASELCERADDVRVIRNETRRLHENAERFSQLRYVRGGDHAAYGIEIFVSETGTDLSTKKPKKGQEGKPTMVFVAFKVQNFPFHIGLGNPCSL